MEKLSAPHRELFERHAKRLRIITDFNDYREEVINQFRENFILSDRGVRDSELRLMGSWIDLMKRARAALGKDHSEELEIINSIFEENPCNPNAKKMIKEVCNNNEAMAQVLKQFKAYNSSFTDFNENINRVRADINSILLSHDKELLKLAKMHWMHIDGFLEESGLSNISKVLVSVRNLDEFNVKDVIPRAKGIGLSLTDQQVRSALNNSPSFKKASSDSFKLTKHGNDHLMEVMLKIKTNRIHVKPRRSLSKWQRIASRPDMPSPPKELLDKCSDLVGMGYNPRLNLFSYEAIANYIHFGKIGAAKRALPEDATDEEVHAKAREIHHWIKSKKKTTPGIRELIDGEEEDTGSFADFAAEFEDLKDKGVLKDTDSRVQKKSLPEKPMFRQQAEEPELPKLTNELKAELTAIARKHLDSGHFNADFLAERAVSRKMIDDLGVSYDKVKHEAAEIVKKAKSKDL